MYNNNETRNDNDNLVIHIGDTVRIQSQTVSQMDGKLGTVENAGHINNRINVLLDGFRAPQLFHGDEIYPGKR